MVPACSESPRPWPAGRQGRSSSARSARRPRDGLEIVAAAGMDVARINFSHGSPASHAAAALAVASRRGCRARPVAILADLAGPKIRLGELAGGSSTSRPAGRSSFGDSARVAGRRRVPAQPSRYRRLAADVRPGDPILLADGAAELRVTAIRDDAFETEVVRGGAIRSRAGVGIPAERLSTPALTAKDRADIPRAIALGADLRRPVVRPQRRGRRRRCAGCSDATARRSSPRSRRARRSTTSTPILDVADAVMIARGDIGVEMPVRGGAAHPEAARPAGARSRRAVDRRHPDARVDDWPRRARRGPRRATSPTRSSTARTRSCCQRRDGDRRLPGPGRRGGRADLPPVREAGERASARGMRRPRNGRRRARLRGRRARDGAERDRGIACYTRTGSTARILASLRPASRCSRSRRTRPS